MGVHWGDLLIFLGLIALGLMALGTLIALLISDLTHCHERKRNDG